LYFRNVSHANFYCYRGVAMTRDEAKRCISLIFQYHFMYDNNQRDMIPFTGQLNNAVCDIQDRLDVLLDKIYQEHYDSVEGIKYAYEESITALTSQGEEDYA